MIELTSSSRLVNTDWFHFAIFNQLLKIAYQYIAFNVNMQLCIYF